MNGTKNILWQVANSLTLKLLIAWNSAAHVALAAAEEVPRWELGVGLGSLYLPDYHGSDEYRGYVFPIPYAVYRGDTIRIDDSGLYGEVVDTDILKIDFSAGAGLPVSSEKNKARRGMPALDPSVEIGPLLTVFLRKSATRNFSLNFALRKVLFLGKSGFEDGGFVLAPYLHYEIKGNSAWNRYHSLYFVLGPTYGDKRYHQTFYEVQADQATAERAEYHPREGYQGFRITATFKRRYDRYWMGAFVQYETLRGAVFEESPLVKIRDYTAFGLASSWVFYP